MTGETIKSFLVGLGFAIDDASLAKFNKAIATATLRVAALYGSIKLASAGILYTISEISEGFEKMGYEYRIIAPAINKALVLRRELLKAYAAAGINIQKVIQNSVKLNFSLTKTKFAFEAIYRSVASRFFELITKQSDAFRQKLYQNMPKIQEILERIVKFIFTLLDATIQLGIRVWSVLSRVVDFFKDLDHATDGWSTALLGLVAAWKLLNLSFLATPLGLIIAGLTAILVLFDDFKTFQEGGESLFNWSSFVPVIDSVADALKSVWSVLQSIADVIGNVVLGFYQLYKGDSGGALESLQNGLGALASTFTNLWHSMQGLAGIAGTLGQWGAGLLGASPLGVGGSSNQSSVINQNVNQQTTIGVSGVADATLAGSIFAKQQYNTNFDLVRNLKGVLR